MWPAGTSPWWLWLMPITFASPWLVAIFFYWRRGPRDDTIPQSMAERAQKRLWS